MQDPSSDPAAGERQRAAALFTRLIEIMQTLRGPNGCPWDREQTLDSLSRFVIEEAYEVVDAIQADDVHALRAEIGDLIFEGVFLAQLCDEQGRFHVADALQAIVDKLIRRHPHVFGSDATADTPEAVKGQWERIKADERAVSGGRQDLLAGIPRTLPALLHAHTIGGRVAAVGFDWQGPGDVIDKIDEEVAELRRANATEGRQRAEEELGDLLFTIANLARKLDIEPEAALRRANAKFARRFAALEQHLEAHGRSIHDASLAEMEDAWGHVKQIR